MTRYSRGGGGVSDQLLAQRVWRERQLAGVSREALGAALGVSADAIAQFECGEDRMSPPELALIAARLGTPLSFFCRPAEEENAAAPDGWPGPRAARLAVRRPLALLATPAFAQVQPLLQLWRNGDGELTDHVHGELRRHGLHHRAVLVRNPADSARLITQHIGAGIMVMHPCEALFAVERDFAVHHRDRDYAAWVTDAYAETLWRRHPRLDAVRAIVRTEAAALRVRYDRLIIPWRRGSDWFAMAVSIQRELPVLAS